MTRVDPTPTIAPVMVWVVLTGTPSAVAVNSEMAPAVSAAKPPTGCSRVIFEPMVLTMRQPPDSVPRAMAMCAAMMTQKGIVSCPFTSCRYPPATSTPAMMPMVFCASLPPCPRL